MVSLSILAVLAAGIGAAAAGPMETDLRTVSVRGEGEVRVAPNEATFSISVWKEAKDPKAARRDLSLAARKVIAALKRNGVADKDMQTARVSIAARYRHDRGRRELSGYRADTTIVVRTRDLDGYDKLISAAMDAGANELRGLTFSHSGLDKLRRKARQNAVENAKERASSLARSAGARLGRVHSIEGQPDAAPRPMHAVRRADLGGKGISDEPSLAGGEIVVRAQVQIVWELAD